MCEHSRQQYTVRVIEQRFNGKRTGVGSQCTVNFGNAAGQVISGAIAQNNAQIFQRSRLSSVNGSVGKLQVFRLSHAELYKYRVGIGNCRHGGLTVGNIVAYFKGSSINAPGKRIRYIGFIHINLRIFKHGFLCVYGCLCLVARHNGVIESLFGNSALLVKFCVAFGIYRSVGKLSTGIGKVCLCLQKVGAVGTRVNRVQNLPRLNGFAAVKILAGNLPAYLCFQLHFLLSLHKAGIIVNQRCITLYYLHGFYKRSLRSRCFFAAAAGKRKHSYGSKRCNCCFAAPVLTQKIQHKSIPPSNLSFKYKKAKRIYLNQSNIIIFLQKQKGKP